MTIKPRHVFALAWMGTQGAWPAEGAYAGLDSFNSSLAPLSTCFVKGTLVHTKGGLVPIEQIKIGDLVLSKPESGEGVCEYKRVTRTFEHVGAEVVRLTYRFKEDSKYDFIDTTENHPFWVNELGWTEVSELGYWPGKEKWLQLSNGSVAFVYEKQPIFRTSKPNIGWISDIGGLTDVVGYEWDFDNVKLHRDQADPDEVWANDKAPLNLTVYNIEVEDFHTYFVGKDGVWVHNKNIEEAIQVSVKGARLELGKDRRQLQPRRRHIRRYKLSS